MRKAKKPLRRGCIYLIRHKGERIGTVEAPDADAAIRVAIEEYGITDPNRQHRLVAQPVEVWNAGHHSLVLLRPAVVRSVPLQSAVPQRVSPVGNGRGFQRPMRDCFEPSARLTRHLGEGPVNAACQGRTA